MKEIPLSRGMVALIDDEDFERISQFNWHAHLSMGKFYAQRKIKVNKKTIGIYMHKEIIQATDRKRIDHRDGNGLNNQRYNLRECTAQENMQNRPVQKNNKSGLKGVSWHKGEGKWRSVIETSGKHKHLGYFPTKELAAAAYNNAAQKYFGEFARINDV
jgi:hypothetical protein